MNNIAHNQEICSVCETEPEDMLILSCRHNLCLDCATEVYNLGNKDDRIVCEICLSETNLDNDTIVCLRSLSAKSLRSPHSQYQPYQQSQNHLNYPPHPQQKLFAFQHQIHPQNSHHFEQPSITPTVLCQKHNQPLTYFCLECNFYKICSQCMLQQNHRYHKVLTLKKASQHIKESIQKVGREKTNLKNLLQKDRDNLILRREDSEKQLQTNLHYLRQSFEKLTKIIFSKQEQMQRKMQQQASRKLQIMDGAIDEIQQKIKLIEDTIAFQDQLVSEAMPVNDKGSNGGSILKMFQYYESEMGQNKINFEPNLPNFISEVHQQKIDKDQLLQSVQYILDQLSLKCFEGEPSQNENINHMSQIDPENAAMREIYHENQIQDQKQQFIKMKNLPSQQYSNTKFKAKRLASENINIIQKTSQTLYKPSDKKQAKKPRQGIQVLKRKARQNFKDRQLSNSRKIQLSRSIVNATDILNKIQQRSAKI